MPGIFKMPSWAKAQSCEIDRRAILLSKRHERLEGLELDDGIDLDVAAHRRRAVAHRHVEHRPRPRANVLHGEAALGVAGDADRLLERPEHARRALGQERLVEMDMRIHQPRRHRPPAAVDQPMRRATRQRPELGDRAAPTADVGCAPIDEATVVQEQIERRHRPGHRARSRIVCARSLSEKPG